MLEVRSSLQSSSTTTVQFDTPVPVAGLVGPSQSTVKKRRLANKSQTVTSSHKSTEAAHQYINNPELLV